MLDTVDYGIIKLLQEDGRMSYADVARQLSTSESTVRRRLGRLVKGGYIKITAVPEPRKVGMNAMAFIGLQVDLSMALTAAQELAQKPEVQYVAACTGPFDIMILVTLVSLEDLSLFLNKEIASVRGVRKSETFVILEIHKRTFGFLPRPEKEAKRRRARARAAK